jgi:hypothetical protein
VRVQVPPSAPSIKTSRYAKRATFLSGLFLFVLNVLVNTLKKIPLQLVNGFSGIFHIKNLGGILDQK